MLGKGQGGWCRRKKCIISIFHPTPTDALEIARLSGEGRSCEAYIPGRFYSGLDGWWGMGAGVLVIQLTLDTE